MSMDQVHDNDEDIDDILDQQQEKEDEKENEVDDALDDLRRKDITAGEIIKLLHFISANRGGQGSARNKIFRFGLSRK